MKCARGKFPPCIRGYAPSPYLSAMCSNYNFFARPKRANLSPYPYSHRGHDELLLRRNLITNSNRSRSLTLFILHYKKLYSSSRRLIHLVRFSPGKSYPYYLFIDSKKSYHRKISESITRIIIIITIAFRN